MRQRQQHEGRLQALQDIEREMGQTLDRDGVLEILVKRAAQHIGAESAAIALHDRRTDLLKFVAAIGSDAEARKKSRQHVWEGRGISRRVFQSRQSVLIEDLRNEPTWKDAYLEISNDVVAELDVPLEFQNEIIGVMNFESPRPGAFKSPDRFFLEALRAPAVIAINNAREYEFTRALSDVDKKIIQQLTDEREVMRTILEYALKFTIALRAAVHLFDDDHPLATIYVSELMDTDATPSFGEMRRDDPSTLMDRWGMAIVEQSHSTFYGCPVSRSLISDGQPYRVNELLAVPLESEGNLLGVLTLVSDQGTAFSERNIDAVETLARQAVIGLQKSRNLEGAQRDQQRFRLRNEVGPRLSKIVDPGAIDEAYTLVADIAHRHFDAQVAIRRYDRRHQELELVKGSVGGSGVRLDERVSVDEESADGYVYRTRRALTIPDAKNPPEGVPVKAADPSINSMVIVPIQFGTTYYGNLDLSHDTVNHFEGRDVDLIEGLAQELGTTIYLLDAVRASEEAEREATENALMSQIGVTSSGLSHQLSNTLPLVPVRVRSIRKKLDELKVDDREIDDLLTKVVDLVERAHESSKGLRENLERFRESRSSEQPLVDIQVEDVLAGATRDTADWPPNIVLNTETPPSGLFVRGVPREVVSILQVLVNNAIRAMSTERGGTLTLRARALGERVEIDVVDTGPGIPPDRQARLFKLEEKSSRGSGFGFGLWSARRMARANGGDLRFRTDESVRTTFTLELAKGQANRSSPGARDVR